MGCPALPLAAPSVTPSRARPLPSIGLLAGAPQDDATQPSRRCAAEEARSSAIENVPRHKSSRHLRHFFHKKLNARESATKLMLLHLTDTI